MREILDYHHLLYQKNHWKVGYAKLLREHPYMGKMIPKQTLHRAIHAKIHDVPTPNGCDCKRAYFEILRLEQEGLIDVEHDHIEKRLDVLINIWRDTCPATVAILEWQKQVVQKFYQRRQ